MKRLEKIEKRVNAATQEPLVVTYSQNGNAVVGPADKSKPRIAMLAHAWVSQPDAELFANASSDLRFLLDFAKAAKEALELAMPVLRGDYPHCDFKREWEKAAYALALLETSSQQTA